MNLVLVLLFGLTVLIGTVIVLVCHKKWIEELSIGMAFSVIVLLLLFELIPEALEHCNFISVIGFAVLGFVLIKILDLFIPSHTHSKDSSHIYHIGIMASVALILHNIIEGMALYTSLASSTKLGLLIGIGIGLHNIPMGMVIGSAMYDKTKNIWKTLLISLVISLSTFVGGLFISLFNQIITDYVIGILLSITIGMLIYMVIFELLHHLEHQDKRNTFSGLILGIIIFLISLIFHTH